MSGIIKVFLMRVTGNFLLKDDEYTMGEMTIQMLESCGMHHEISNYAYPEKNVGIILDTGTEWIILDLVLVQPL